MQTQIDELKQKLNLVSSRLRSAEQVRSDAKTQLDDIKNQVSRLAIKKQLLGIAAWNNRCGDADPIWNFVFPISLVAVLLILIFPPVWFLTGSIIFAAIFYLLVAFATLGGFLLINVSYSSNADEKIESLATDLDAVQSLHDSRSKYFKSCREAVRKIGRDKLKIENQLSELTASAAYHKELRINSILSQEWQLLRGVPWEKFLLQLLECHDFDAEMTSASGDQGVDLIATRHEASIAIQAKGYANNVGNTAVQQVYTGMAVYGCTHCVVITNSEFTSSAREAAEKTGCILIGCSDILSFANGTLESFFSIGKQRRQPAG